jgi:hypothetical protein
MQMKPKKDELERSVGTFWAGLWGVWGLITALDFAATVINLPGAAKLGIVYWCLILAPLHLATLGFLALRRHNQGRDD